MLIIVKSSALGCYSLAILKLGSIPRENYYSSFKWLKKKQSHSKMRLEGRELSKKHSANTESGLGTY